MTPIHSFSRSLLTVLMLLAVGAAIGLGDLANARKSPLKVIPSLPAAMDSDDCKVTLVDFYGRHCGACQYMAPKVNKLRRKYDDKLKVVHVEVNHPNNRGLVYDFKVDSTPLYFLFGVDGKPLTEQRYQVDDYLLEKNIKKAIKTEKTALKACAD